MTPELQKIPEWYDIDEATFRDEIVAHYRPAVLRGLVKDWPAVRCAQESPEALCRYLCKRDSGGQVDALLMRPEVRGRIFYNEDMSGFNYVRNRVTISAVVEQLLRYARFPDPPAVAVQSAPVADCLPGFLRENRLPWLGDDVAPRIWMGNRVTTPAHFDESQNIACVIAGRRRFTLFPPQQIADLYIGPLGFAPTGTPISMVDFDRPNFARYPRFKAALAAAQVAELGPGDAIYIPTLWFHHVRSLEQCNVLVNYWWKGAVGGGNDKIDSALDCLLHSLLNLKRLAPEQKRAWQTIFEHYVFNTASDPAAHLPAGKRGLLGEMTPELEREIKAFLITQLSR